MGWVVDQRALGSNSDPSSEIIMNFTTSPSPGVPKAKRSHLWDVWRIFTSPFRREQAGAVGILCPFSLFFFFCMSSKILDEMYLSGFLGILAQVQSSG